MDQVVPFLFLYHHVLFPEPYPLLPAKTIKPPPENIPYNKPCILK
jgi:hypothetical protein